MNKNQKGIFVSRDMVALCIGRHLDGAFLPGFSPPCERTGVTERSNRLPAIFERPVRRPLQRAGSTELMGINQGKAQAPIKINTGLWRDGRPPMDGPPIPLLQ